MKPIASLTLEALARALDRKDQEAVLGDILESGEGAWRGMLEVLGLVMRRQAGLWKGWQPWLASLGIAVPSSFLLMGFSLSICFVYHKIVGAGLSDAAALTKFPNILILAGNVFLLVGWSWSTGFLVGSVSKRTICASILSYCAPCLFCLARFRVESLSRYCLLLFAVPATFGVFQGFCGSVLRLVPALSMAAAVTALAIAERSQSGQGWWSPRTWFLISVLTWPAWFLVAAAWKKRDRALPASVSQFGGEPT